MHGVQRWLYTPPSDHYSLPRATVFGSHTAQRSHDLKQRAMYRSRCSATALSRTHYAVEATHGAIRARWLESSAIATYDTAL
jgi:hypothetical protein